MKYFCPKCDCDQEQGHICVPTRYEQEEWRLQGGLEASPDVGVKKEYTEPNLATDNLDWRWK